MIILRPEAISYTLSEGSGGTYRARLEVVALLGEHRTSIVLETFAGPTHREALKVLGDLLNVARALLALEAYEITEEGTRKVDRASAD